MPRCDECPFDTDTVQGFGPQDADLAFVGQAPAKEEVKRGRPFVGRSGIVLRGALDELGWDLDDFYTTNCVLCRLPHGKDTPYSKCRSRLMAELKEVNPQVIVCLGTDAWKSVMDTDRGVMSVRGRFFWQQELEAVILPTMHPAACLHEPTATASAFRDLMFDLQKLKDRSIAGGFSFDDLIIPSEASCTHEPPEIQTNIITDTEEAKDFYRWTKDSLSFDRIAADIETTGFDPRTEELLCIGFCYRQGQATILTPEAIEKDVLSYYLTMDDLDFIWHNGKFDVKFLREHDIEASVDKDTMLMHYTMDERSGVHSLEYMAGQYFNAPRWEEQFKEEYVEDGDYSAVTGSILYEYNALDVHYTLRLYQRLQSRLSEHNTRVTEEILYPAANTLANVELRGIELDVEHLEEVQQEYDEQLDELRSELMSYAKRYGWSTGRYVEETGAKSEPEEINFNSDQQMWHLFFDLVGLPKYHGERSVREEARNWMREVTDDEDKIEFLDCYEDYKKLRHSYDLYIKGLPSYQEDDGRIRSSYNIHRTVTGRLSSSNPNLQNIARNKQIKNAFVAPEGKLLLEADYSQAELRVLAHLSGDEFLNSVYQEGGDLHDETAERLFGENFTKEQRVVAKTVNFGIAYGITADGLSSRSKLEYDEAEQTIESWFEMAPGVESYFDEITEKALSGEPVLSCFGRARRFPLKKNDNKHKIEREACNHVIQSPASDITLLSGINLSKKFKVVNLVHDSVVIECDKEDWKEVAAECYEVMPEIAEEALDADIPFEVDVEGGKRWGELKEVPDPR